MRLATGERLAAEIREQGEVLARLWGEERAVARAVGLEIRSRMPHLAVVVARGTSDHAATYGKYLLEALAGIPVALAAPSLFTLYGRPPRLHGALVMALSQSGASPDVVQVVADARSQGAITVAVVNRPSSPLAAAAEHVLSCHAGVEESVAATKSYTAELFVLAMLVEAIAPEGGTLQGMAQLPERVADLAGRGEELTRPLAAGLAQSDTCLVAGRGFQYATALEMALKLKEMARVWAQGYSAADLRHGPITLVGPHVPTVLVSSRGPSAPDMVELADRCRELGAPLWGITDDPVLADRLDGAVRLPEGVAEPLGPILAAPVLQWWALEAARARGVDPDHPVAIAKVTRTR